MVSKDDQWILSQVDEYTIFCYYLGYEPIPNSGTYRSPIRENDSTPSFSLIYAPARCNMEYLFKDRGTGVAGDIFKLVQLIYKYKTRTQAKERVIGDFGLDPSIPPGSRPKITHHPAPPPMPIKISVRSRHMNNEEKEYWEVLNIGPDLLRSYHVNAVSLYWLSDREQYPRAPGKFCFSYRIWAEYQLYWPKAKDKRRKFRCNFGPYHIGGLCQLKYNQPLLVITKSIKDVIHLRSFGYEAICPIGEHNTIPTNILQALETRYKRIVTLFDNDGKHRTDYPYSLLHLPPGPKDPTDFCLAHGIQASGNILTDLLTPYL